MSTDVIAHAYNAPGLSPSEFQAAVMNDPTVPMEYRLRASEDLRGIPRTTIFDMFPQHQWPSIVSDMSYIAWCYDHGMLDPNLPSSHALYAKAQIQ
jgi:hypothetical protein